MNILLIGSGGREHALAWKISGSPLCDRLFIAPGNPGTARCGTNIALDPGDHAAIAAFCRTEIIDLVVVGPEAPLVAGLVDDLAAAGSKVFGPRRAAAQLEGSKAFTKELCREFGIPTAAFARFTESPAAKAYVRERGAPIVVKADGLAAGKGVVVAATVEEAEALVESVDDEESSRFAAGALEELRSRSAPEGRDAIAVIALSYGAPFALRLSTERPEAISAVVLFYGTGGPADYRRARSAYLGHFAERDPYEDEESIGALEAALRDAGREVTFHRYPGTSHWFFERDRAEYDAEAAQLAWERTVAFLRSTLSAERAAGGDER